nr:hypothetical protein CFP56_10382 [Quercus suber]
MSPVHMSVSDTSWFAATVLGSSVFLAASSRLGVMFENGRTSAVIPQSIYTSSGTHNISRQIIVFTSLRNEMVCCAASGPVSMSFLHVDFQYAAKNLDRCNNNPRPTEVRLYSPARSSILQGGEDVISNTPVPKKTVLYICCISATMIWRCRGRAGCAWLDSGDFSCYFFPLLSTVVHSCDKTLFVKPLYFALHSVLRIRRFSSHYRTSILGFAINMAPTIWGLNLGEMQWGKFKGSYMFGNRDFHLRRTKFIVYQCALIFCVVSESLGTAVLSDYIDEQSLIQRLDSNAHQHNDDYVGAASYNIFAGIFVAFIFGGAFFFDLFWPARKENYGVRLAWKICGVLSVIFYLASALTLTVITATHSAYVTGVSEARGQALAGQFHKDGGVPLEYKHNGRAIAAVVFAWLGWVSVVGSCVLLFLSIDHTESGPGPMSEHARQETRADPEAAFLEKDLAEPQTTLPTAVSSQGSTTNHAAPAAEDIPAHPGFEAANARSAADVEHPETGARL